MDYNQIGKTVTLVGKNGFEVALIEFGARVESIRFNNKEMLVRYNKTTDIAGDPFALGATCGRVANRIEHAEYVYNGELIQVAANEGLHCLHGGKQNFANQKWQLSEHDERQQIAIFTLHSPDGDQGFPGEVVAKATYQVSGTSLQITYTAHTNKTSPIDLTNHCYFNLGEEDCFDLELSVNADRYLPKSKSNVPSGIIANITSDPIDALKTVQQHLSAWQQNTRIDGAGFDHYFIFDENKNSATKATLRSNKNGIKMTLKTDQHGIQLYTSGSLGRPFKAYSGVCLEAQNYPNAVNTPHFPSPFVSPKQTYKNTIQLDFSMVTDEYHFG
jgi:aldose 1-epimerase